MGKGGGMGVGSGRKKKVKQARQETEIKRGVLLWGKKG